MDISTTIDKLTFAMIEYDKGDAMRIQHMLEDDYPEYRIDGALNHIFKTDTGKRLCNLQFKEEYIRPQGKINVQ